MHNSASRGVSDRAATTYIEEHGNARWVDIAAELKTHRCACPKLTGFEAYRGCGYRKAQASCQNPVDIGDCPVPSLPLRKGTLNQLAFSLFFFLRDRCQGDLVGFIESIFAEAEKAEPDDPSAQSARL